MLHATEYVTCPILNQAGNFHFEGRCEDCEVHRTAWLTMGQVEDRYHQGRLGQDLFEAYMFSWVTSAFHYASFEGWEVVPTDPTVRRLVRKIFRDRRRPVPGALIDCLPAGRYVTVAGGHVIDLDAEETLPDDDTEQFEPGYRS